MEKKTEGEGDILRKKMEARNTILESFRKENSNQNSKAILSKQEAALLKKLHFTVPAEINHASSWRDHAEDKAFTLHAVGPSFIFGITWSTGSYPKHRTMSSPEHPALNMPQPSQLSIHLFIYLSK